MAMQWGCKRDFSCIFAYEIILAPYMVWHILSPPPSQIKLLYSLFRYFDPQWGPLINYVDKQGVSQMSTLFHRLMQQSLLKILEILLPQFMNEWHPTQIFKKRLKTFKEDDTYVRSSDEKYVCMNLNRVRKGNSFYV